MSEAEERARVVAIALEWERTPYVSEGRVKYKAADCTFFSKVFEEAGLLLPVDIPHYSAQAHLNRQASAYLALVMRYAKREITEADAQPADVVMFRIARTFSHGAMIMPPGWPEILHADLPARMVSRGRGDLALLGSVQRRFFSFW